MVIYPVSSYFQHIYYYRWEIVNENGTAYLEQINWTYRETFYEYIPVRYEDNEGDPFPPAMIRTTYQKDCDDNGWKFSPQEWKELLDLKGTLPTYFYDEDYGSNGGYSLG